MQNDPLARATRNFSFTAGLTLLLFPIIALVLDILELRTLPVRWSRDVAGFMLLVAFMLFASVMLDFTLTISRVAERLLPRESEAPAAAIRRSRRLLVRLAVGVAVIVVVAVVLDHFAVQRLEARLGERSRRSIAQFTPAIEKMGDYRYAQDWLDQTTLNLTLIERQGNYASVALIVQDSINGQPVYLSFSDNSSIREGESEPRIQQLLQSSGDEQAYLEGVFRGGKTGTQLSVSSRRSHMLVPVQAGGRVVVLRFVIDEW